MVCVIHNAGPGNIPECNIPERYTQRRPYDTSGAIALPPSKKKNKQNLFLKIEFKLFKEMFEDPPECLNDVLKMR